jgi:putative iron-dependent peroxidase
MTADQMPANAHIARVQVTEGEEELEIYRRSVPYGTVDKHGLYFVAFSAERTRYDRMLERMFGLGQDGVHDRLTDFSRPVSGAFYFAPSLTTLREMGQNSD